MGKNTKFIECEDDNCNYKFHENDFAYRCEECKKFYCFKCFCENHFENHSEWHAYKVKNGKLEPMSINTDIDNLKTI